MKLQIWLSLILCCILLCPTACAQQAALCATDQWTPPDLSALSEDAPIQLRVLKIAQQEVGYTQDKNGETKYVDWLGSTSLAWCTEFVSWCVDQADQQWGTSYLGTIYPRVGTATESALYFIKNDRYIGANGCNFDGEPQWLIGENDYLAVGGYIPSAGDIIWFYLYGGADMPDHTAIVEGVSMDDSGDIWVHVIEGNIDPFVRRYAYRLSDPTIIGYGTTETLAYTLLARNSRYGGLKALRQDLASLGYQAGGNTYRMESALVSAVKQFQADHGIAVTGTVNIETRNALNIALEGVKE